MCVCVCVRACGRGEGGSPSVAHAAFPSSETGTQLKRKSSSSALFYVHRDRRGYYSIRGSRNPSGGEVMLNVLRCQLTY